MSNTSLIAPPVSTAMILDFAVERVNLPAEVAKERREKVNDLRKRLRAWMQEHPECGLVKSYLSGSLRKGTALKSSSDVDVALYVKYDGKQEFDPELLEWIAERLRKAYPQMAPGQITPKTYSVGIEYKTAGIDIDVVPVFYDDDPDDRGLLVSQDDGSTLMTSIPMHLEFIRKRKAAQEKHFAQSVRLIKWWAAEQKYKDAGFRFKSFMVELICAHLPAESVYAVFEVKQTLNAYQVRYAGKKIRSVRALHRTSIDVPTVSGVQAKKPLHDIVGGLLTVNSQWGKAFGNPFKKALAALPKMHRLDIGCSARDGVFEAAYSEGKPCEVSHGKSDAPLALFLLRLIDRLRTIATVPAIDICAYAARIQRG